MSQELAKFDDLKAEVATLVAPTKDVRVTDFKSSEQAISVAKQVDDFLKRVDKRRKELGDPLRLTVERINAYAKDLAQPLREAREHLDKQLSTFAAEQHRIEQARLKQIEDDRIKAEEALRAKQAEEVAAEAESIALFGADEPEAESETIAEPIEVRHAQEVAVLRGDAKTEAWHASQRKIKNTAVTYKMVIVDISKVPDNLLIKTVNEKAAQAMRAAGVEIPGIKFEEEFTVRIGSKTRVPRAALSGQDDGWKP